MQELMQSFAVMRDMMTRQGREMRTAVEAVTVEVAAFRTELRELRTAVGDNSGEVGSMRTQQREFVEIIAGVQEEVGTMKTDTREFFEILGKTLQAQGGANIEGLEAVGTIKSDVETIKAAVDKVHTDVQVIGRGDVEVLRTLQEETATMTSVYTLHGDVQTIKGAVDKVMTDSQVNGQSLRTLQEEMATIKSALANQDAADGAAVHHAAADGAVSLGRPLTPQMEQSVVQTAESVQQVQGELQNVTQAVQSVKGDVETMRKAVDAIRETLRGPAEGRPRRNMSTSQQGAPSSCAHKHLSS